jgi:hypothetical protein
LQPSVLVKDLIVARFIDRKAKDQSMTGVQYSEADTLLSPRRQPLSGGNDHSQPN